jgi:predicted RNA binding protein YcfA (HicA-like mRNA interferase family)
MELSRLSGAECVEQLRQLGFKVTREARGMTLLEREGSRVAVPAIDVVDGALLASILRSAGIDFPTFLGLRKRSGVYARVDTSGDDDGEKHPASDANRQTSCR